MMSDSLPIDSYYVEHPNELFDKSVDDLLLDLDSKLILEAHLHCAAFEVPLCVDDSTYFGPHMQELCATRLVKDKESW